MSMQDNSKKLPEPDDIIGDEAEKQRSKSEKTNNGNGKYRGLHTDASNQNGWFIHL